jgi:hypothetical protein
VAESGSLDFVARDKRLDFRQSNSGNGRLFSATIGPVQGDAHGSGGAGDERKGSKAGGCMIRCSESGDIAVMAGCGRSGKGPLGVFCPGNGIFHWCN